MQATRRPPPDEERERATFPERHGLGHSVIFKWPEMYG